jgi:hypothetical protein
LASTGMGCMGVFPEKSLTRGNVAKQPSSLGNSVAIIKLHPYNKINSWK